MSATSDYYLTHAETCARDAEAATLENLRERCRRSEVSWRAMADRLHRAEAMRPNQVAEKALRE